MHFYVWVREIFAPIPTTRFFFFSYPVFYFIFYFLIFLWKFLYSDLYAEHKVYNRTVVVSNLMNVGNLYSDFFYTVPIKQWILELIFEHVFVKISEDSMSLGSLLFLSFIKTKQMIYWWALEYSPKKSNKKSKKIIKKWFVKEAKNHSEN